MSGGRVLSAQQLSVKTLSALMLGAVTTVSLLSVAPAAQAQVQLLGSKSGVLRASELTESQKQQLAQRIKVLLQNPEPVAQYHAQKAQSWLDYANHQNSEGGLTSAYDSAMQQALQIATQLEQGQQPSMTTAVPPTSGVMRRDLWAIAELLKTHPAFAQVQTDVAKAEVKLVWAAAEHCELGWRHSREHFAAAERELYLARQTANQQAGAPQWPENLTYPTLAELNGSGKGCNGVQGSWPLPVPLWTVATPAISVPQPQPEAAVNAELIKVPNNVHFALDKHYLTAESKAVLDQIIAVLRQYPDISVTLYGYTDRRASIAYNIALSQRRATSVEQYLVSQGINLSRIAREAKGETQLLSDQDMIRGHALSRRVEVVFANKGEEIITERQTADLQLERRRR
jgi:outer membrane protein OmpA-like peptidoglycan-associated protein